VFEPFTAALSTVMAGLGPAIHGTKLTKPNNRHARIKSGHDGCLVAPVGIGH